MSARAVMLHAFAEDADGQTYCEPDDPQLTGWCVYIRVGTEGGQIEVPEEADFPTYELAKAHAVQLAAADGLALHEY